MRLHDMLVVCDMDGTLLDKKMEISASNLETIRLFTSLGGHFTVATGRTPASVNIYPQLTPLLAPAITCGGCVIYDFKREQAAKTTLLPHLAARQAIRQLTQAFPYVGVLIFADDMRIYQLRPSKHLMTLLHEEKMAFFAKPDDCLPESWNKVLFSGPSEILDEMRRFVASRTYPGVYFVSTHAYYFEMMPKGVSKGSALHELCALTDVSIHNTYAIGDYYNDLDIMRQAGYAVAMQNAPDEVKQAANVVTDSNDNSGVGQFLYSLIRKYA